MFDFLTAIAASLLSLLLDGERLGSTKQISNRCSEGYRQMQRMSLGASITYRDRDLILVSGYGET